MFYRIFLIFTFMQLKEVEGHKKIDDHYQIYPQNDSYRGEKFPEKFLTTDGVIPTSEDFTYYVNTLSRVVDYFAVQLNDTDPNVSIGSFLMQSVLKRILIDYNDRINIKEKSIIKSMIFKSENILSHFIADNSKYGPGDLGYELSHLFRYDESLVCSIGKFNKNALQKWITSNLQLHDYAEQFDTLALPKEKYAEIVIDMDLYYKVADSDTCLARISRLHMPVRKDAEMESCRRDHYCEKKVFNMPSVAYALSHRYLYLALVVLTRRCYIVSEAVDQMHMDIMCASMYRETVYLARRGYFYRDLFLEHIALCALLGYEEFSRNSWFKKAASWIDEDGCMEEFRNFEVNRTNVYLSRTNSTKAAKTLRRMRSMHLNEECAHHQMALVMNVLAHGIRHAARFMKLIL